jgi:hypothetical protein
MFRSTDNGNSWVEIENGIQRHDIGAITVDAAGNVYAGNYYGVYKSTSNGDSWVNIGGAGGAKGLKFNSQGDLFLASYGGGFWKLPAGDTVWVDLTANYGYNWISSLFISSNDYIYADGKRSTDNGLTWTATGINTGVAGFAENSVGHIFCATTNFGSGVWRSTDNGDTWEQINSGLPAMDVRSVAVDSEDYLYAGPWGYSLFKTTTPTVTDADDINFALTSFSLEQNYPNPFNPSTKISWQTPVGSWQTLKVYDVLANEVAILVDEYKPAGNYEVNFDARGLTSGIYFYQLKAGAFVETKKMLLLK